MISDAGERVATADNNLQTQAAILSLIAELARERKMATILITHDLAMPPSTATASW